MTCLQRPLGRLRYVIFVCLDAFSLQLLLVDLWMAGDDLASTCVEGASTSDPVLSFRLQPFFGWSSDGWRRLVFNCRWAGFVQGSWSADVACLSLRYILFSFAIFYVRRSHRLSSLGYIHLACRTRWCVCCSISFLIPLYSLVVLFLRFAYPTSPFKNGAWLPATSLHIIRKVNCSYGMHCKNDSFDCKSNGGIFGRRRAEFSCFPEP